MFLTQSVSISEVPSLDDGGHIQGLCPCWPGSLDLVKFREMEKTSLQCSSPHPHAHPTPPWLHRLIPLIKDYLVLLQISLLNTHTFSENSRQFLHHPAESEPPGAVWIPGVGAEEWKESRGHREAPRIISPNLQTYPRPCAPPTSTPC